VNWLPSFEHHRFEHYHYGASHSADRHAPDDLTRQAGLMIFSFPILLSEGRRTDKTGGDTFRNGLDARAAAEARVFHRGSGGNAPPRRRHSVDNEIASSGKLSPSG
jgi:hypothetical protein